jgi:hypothetical protein
MRSSSRTRRPGAPEAEQRDAIVEYEPDLGAYLVGYPGIDHSHFVAIYYCPWCGTRLPEIVLPANSN